MPWHLPADLAYFKKITLNKPVIMGRSCYQSIGRLLPNRKNIILSHDLTYRVDQAFIAHTREEAVKLADNAAEVMVIGGSQIYALFLPFVSRIYLTEIHASLPGDTFFPAWDKSWWREVSREMHVADDKNAYDYSFIVYERP